MMVPALVNAVLGLPAWPLSESRFILNPSRGSSIPTATCVAQFNTPCAIEKIHQIVYDLAESFEAAVTPEDFDALLAAINAREHNQPVLFWPTVLNGTGHILATGTEASATYASLYPNASYVGSWFPDVLEHEGRQSSAMLGGVFQSRVWSDILAAVDNGDGDTEGSGDGYGYFFTNGKDEYHETGVLRTVPRVNFVMRVASHPVLGGDLYVTSAYSDMPVSDHHATTNCTAAKDAMCSITNVRAVLGNVVTDMLQARDEAELVDVFAAVSNQHYNYFYKGWYTGFYPFIWGMSGLGYAHGANNKFVGSYLNSSARVAIPKLATLHDDLAAAGSGGGGYTAYWWNNFAGEEMYLKVSFTVGVRRFGTSYYIGCGYTHESDAIVAPVVGPHGQPCNIGSNQPCAFTNVLMLVGHIQTLCFMSNMYALSTAFELTTNDASYFYAQPDGFSSAHRNYGFIYDYNQTCVAHGANSGLIGRRLEDIISGIARFDGVLNGTQLHLDFVRAAEMGGAWVAYSWVNAGDVEPYLKLAYVVKVDRDGRQYYLGVGLSDVPLVGDAAALPCSSSFSGPCAEDWALSVAGFRMSTLLQASTHDALLTQLASTHENTAAVSAGGSPFGFNSVVFTTGQVLAAPAVWGATPQPTSDWLLAAGLGSDVFVQERPSGAWLGPLEMRMSPAGAVAAHYLYHITLGIADEVADGELNGLYETYHVVVPVRAAEMPPLVAMSDGDASTDGRRDTGDASSTVCDAVECLDNSGSRRSGELGCTTVVTYASAAYTYSASGNGASAADSNASSVSVCECMPTPFFSEGGVFGYEPEWTAAWSYDTDGMGIEAALQTTYELACRAVIQAQLDECPAGTILKGVDCVACAQGFYELDGSSCVECASVVGADPDCPAGSTVATLRLQQGYWRLSNRTTDIVPCESQRACSPSSADAGRAAAADATTDDGSGYCGDEYRGPLCALCVNETKYFSTASGECEDCPTDGVATGRFLAVTMLVLAFVLLLATFQEIARQLAQCGVAMVVRAVVSLSWLSHAVIHLRLGSKFKLLVSFAQVFSMLPTVYEVSLPEDYESFLGFFDLLNFDLDLLLPRRCVSRDPADILVAYAVAPFGLLALILLLALVGFATRTVQLRKAQARLANSLKLTRSGRPLVAPSPAAASPQQAAPSPPPSPPPEASEPSIAAQEPSSLPAADGSALPRYNSFAELSSAAAENRVALEEAIELLKESISSMWVGVLNVLLVVLFCLAPAVSRRIFSAWSCNTYTYDDATGESRSFLRDDPSVRCSDDDHTSAKHDDLTDLATGFLIVWPVAVPAVWLLLLLLSRPSIIGHTPSVLSRSTKFLWVDYEAQWCWWEVVELVRKIALTGAVLLIPNTRIMRRTLVGLVIALGYTTGLLAFKPYKEGLEDVLAVASAVMMSSLLITALLMKLCDFSATTCDSLGFASSSQISLLFGLVGIAILVVLAIAIAYHVLAAESFHTVRLRSTHRAPELTLDRKLRWHGFVSHYWNSAQDLAALLKRQLTMLCPLMRIFLDVDDLQSIDDLEHYIDQTACVICVLSKGYFSSVNSMREVRHGLKQGKRMALLHESDPNHGGEPLAHLVEECPDAYRKPLFNAAKRTVTPWHRVRDFQLVSLKSLARELLLSTPLYAKAADSELVLYVPGEVASQKLVFAHGRSGRKQHGVRLAYSKDNPGAAAVAAELASSLRFVGGTFSVVPLEKCKLGKLDHSQSRAGGFLHLGSSLLSGEALNRTRSAKSLVVSTTVSAGNSGVEQAESPPPSRRVASFKAVAQASLVATAGPASKNLKRFGGDTTLESLADDAEPSEEEEEKEGARSGATMKSVVLARAATKRLEDALAAAASSTRDSEATGPDAESTEPAPTHVLLYLNDRTFVGGRGRRLATTMRALLHEGHPKILLVHELDEACGGCEFSRFFDTTPRDLIVDGIYKTLATALAPGMHRAVSIALIARAMGARNAGRCDANSKCGSVMQAFEADKKDFGGAGGLMAKDILGRASRTAMDLLRGAKAGALSEASAEATRCAEASVSKV